MNEVVCVGVCEFVMVMVVFVVVKVVSVCGGDGCGMWVI